MKVDTKEVRVIIFIQHFMIVGDMHVLPQGRISDYLNKTLHNPDTFVPLTNVECRNLDGKVLHSTDYMAINKRHIHMIMPYEKYEGQ